MANYKTHVSAGFSVGVIGSVMCFHYGLVDYYALPVTTFVCTLGGIAPDMDHVSRLISAAPLRGD